MISSFLMVSFTFVVIYKFLDYLIRIPRVGNYKDRYILVTGCDTGFGNLIAKRLDQLGCHVFAGCLTEAGETNLKKSCSNRLLAFSLNVTKQESVRKALDYIKANLPKDKGLWGLVNNAGVLLNIGAPDWHTSEDYKKESDVNLWGLIDITLAFLPLVKKEKGRLVNMASTAGRIGFPIMLPYCVSKYGVEAFSDGMRRMIHYFGCRVSIIEPGIHRSPIIHEERLVALSDQSWKNAKSDVKDEYGEEFASYVSKKQFDGLMLLSADDSTPVVDAYEHALLSRFPRYRYVIGKDAKILILLQSLPEWLSDWALRKLESDRPIPTLAKAICVKQTPISSAKQSEL